MLRTDLSSDMPIEVTLTGLSRKPEHFSVPVEAGLYLQKMIRNMARTAPHSGRDSVPVEKVFPVLGDPIMRPAAMLKGYRLRADLTQAELADAIDIKQHRLSEMENGKRGISKDMAKRLAEVLKFNWQSLL